MDFQPITTFARVLKVERKTGRIVKTTYTGMTDNHGNRPNAEDIHRIKYEHKETKNHVYIVSECSHAEYASESPRPAKDTPIEFLRENLYEEMRLAQYTKDYSALCGLLESIPKKHLIEYFTV